MGHSRNKTKPKRLTLPRNMTLREYIKAQVKADPLVIQDRRIIWEKFYKHLPKQ